MEPATTLTLIQIPKSQARWIVDDIGDGVTWPDGRLDYEGATLVGLRMRLDDECPEVPAAVWTELWRRHWGPGTGTWSALPSKPGPPMRLLERDEPRLVVQALVRWHKAVVRSDGSDALAMDVLAVEGLAEVLMREPVAMCGDDLNRLLESVIECVGLEPHCDESRRTSAHVEARRPRELSSRFPVQLPLR